MKKWIIFFPTLFSAFTSPNEELIGAPIPQSCTYLPPSRPCIISDECVAQNNIYLSFDFLYWQAKMDGLEYARTSASTPFFSLSNTSNIEAYNQQSEEVNLSFDWEPAFRIQLGTYLPHDSWWSLDLSFTHLDTCIKNSTLQPLSIDIFDVGIGLIATWTSPLITINQTPGINILTRWSEATASWDFGCNIFDLLLHQSLLMGEALSIKPGFGMKIGTIQQYYTVRYFEGNHPAVRGFPLNSKVSMKNRSFNLGPEFALSSQWRFGKHWNLFGTLSGSLMGSQVTIGRNESCVEYNPISEIIESDEIRLNDRFWTFRPESSLQVGLEWGDCYCRQNSAIHYAFAIGYEGQIWWKQNMFFRYVDGLSLKALAVPSQGDLFFHGLTLSGKVDF